MLPSTDVSISMLSSNQEPCTWSISQLAPGMHSSELIANWQRADIQEGAIGKIDDGVACWTGGLAHIEVYRVAKSGLLDNGDNGRSKMLRDASTS